MAEVTGLPLKVVQMLLITITSEQVERIWEATPLPDSETGEGREKDLHIVLDELQDFFPVSRGKPPKALST